MKYPRKALQNKGFSLIEMLTVIALLSVVTTMGVSFLFKVTDLWDESRTYTGLSHTAEEAFSAIQQDVTRVVSQQLTGVGIVGEQGNFQNNNPESPFFRMLGEDDRLVLPIMETDPATGRTRLTNVSYHVDRTTPMPALFRVLGDFGGEAAGARVGQWNGIWGFRVQYFDGENWHPAWDAEQLPEAIRVSLSVAQSEHLHEQIARSATFTIPVD